MAEAAGRESSASGRPLRLLGARGDATDPSIFSGIPYYFLHAAMKGGIVDGPVPLPRDDFRFAARRIVWNATRPLTGDRHGGYQYNPARRDRQWAAAGPALRGTCILHAWQLLPDFVVADDSIEKWYFIDQTLAQLHEDYGEQSIIGRRIGRHARAAEREGYAAARGVIAHSRWAAQSVIDRYGIDPAKVHVVKQAANIHPGALAEWERSEQARRLSQADPGSHAGPLRLVFVGLDGPRKGLDRLLRGLAIARRGGSQIALRVIGCLPGRMPPELRDVPGVEWCGRIDKRSDAARFLQLVGESDIGCLLSRVEAGGCGLSEYQVLGLAVLGTNAGGAAEQILPGNGLLVDVEATDVEIADTLVDLERHPEKVWSMRQVAWRQRRSATWDARVEEIRTFWPHPSPPGRIGHDPG
ncbi:MAG: glycosyltransferase family 4 protein [Actinomycetota bacterium]|nr:glycosyltransferase family 4 protein [Actinomycetota bacterium]